MLQVAVVSSVSTEALAGTSVIVADTSSRALLQYVGSGYSSSDGNRGGSSTNSGGQIIQGTSIVGEFHSAGQNCVRGSSALNGSVLDDTVGDTLKSSIDQGSI